MNNQYTPHSLPSSIAAALGQPVEEDVIPPTAKKSRAIAGKPHATALTPEVALSRAMAAHEGKNYLWDRFVYTNARSKVAVGCPVHGYFESTYDSVRQGRGCRHCGYTTERKNEAYTKEFVVEKIRKANLDMDGNEYGYDKVEYVDRETKITLTCKIHGDFQVTPKSAMNSHAGCPTCGREKAHRVFRKPIDVLREEISKILPPEKYTLGNTEGYTGNKSDIQMICKEHGPWTTRPNWILSKGYSCPRCTPYGTSKSERDILEFVESEYKGEVVSGSRKVIPPTEVDVFLPELGLAIEFDGLDWHSEKFKDNKHYHLDKTLACEAIGVKLMHVYEDEWAHNQVHVKSEILKAINGATTSPDEVESMKVSLEDPASHRAFFKANHPTGQGRNPRLTLGLRRAEEPDGPLCAAMAVWTSSELQKEGVFEITRIAAIENNPSMLKRLVDAFLGDTPGVKKLTLATDKRWPVTLPLGFVKVGTSSPDYDYCNSQFHRFPREDFMKHKMPNLVASKIFKTFDPALTEVENCKANGYWRVWNCGMDLWEYNVPQQESIVKPRPQASLG